ncbi:MAG: B12-binding domain-containing radical SAM protein [Deltaproteobacteria bacterium]|nr:B12-binding domain-containing radical SAM protein [Deltaproteobacteria bacterium]
MIDALLIYPRLGSMDTMVADPPLSIIYAAADSVKEGFEVKALDLRTVDGDWRQVLKAYLDQGVLLAGVSVMTGSPLRHAREISLYIKDNYPQTKLVWGGPHVTVLPETIGQKYLDFVIRGYGSKALAALIGSLKSQTNDYSAIAGLSYKQDGQAVHNDRSPAHEPIFYKDLPYDLLPLDSPKYSRSYSGEQMFPMFTCIGCPYQCSFCVHPTVYKVINGPKWLPFPDGEVIGHMEHLIDRYGAKHICFIDDTSFPDLERMRRIFKLIIDRGIKVTLEFRGARVNEIDRMDDDFLELMVQAGGRVLMVGVESASDRILKVMQKGITKEQTLRVNRKLARHPQLVPHYNFIYGAPGETYQDLVETKEVVLQLVKDNPQAYFGFGGDWKPIPGSKMLQVAREEYGFKPPQTIDDWIEMDSSDAKSKIYHPWYTPRHNNLIKLMQIASFVIDDGLIKETRANKALMFKTLRLLARLYKPLALFRLRHNLHQFLVEYSLYRLVLRTMSFFNVR